MSLINCKVEFSLIWIENCVLPTAAVGADANATGAESATFFNKFLFLFSPNLQTLNSRF